MEDTKIDGKLNYEYYLHDTLLLLYETALESVNEVLTKDKQNDEVGATFARGRRLAYYEVLSTIKQQAKVFEIDLDNIYKYDPDKLI